MKPSPTPRGRTSRDGALRLDQRIGEEPDFFVMRAFEKVVPYIDQNRALALIEWMRQKSWDPKTWRRR